LKYVQTNHILKSVRSDTVSVDIGPVHSARHPLGDAYVIATGMGKWVGIYCKGAKEAAECLVPEGVKVLWKLSSRNHIHMGGGLLSRSLGIAGP
jgi:hypothetical protein